MVSPASGREVVESHSPARPASAHALGWKERRRGVPTSRDVLRGLARSIRAAEARSRKTRNEHVNICDLPGAKPFSTVFHPPMMLDEQFHAHRSLMNTRQSPTDDRLPEQGLMPSRPMVANHHPDATAKRFRTVWRQPRCSDLRVHAMQDLSLGIHREPFVPAHQRAPLRCSAEDAEQPFLTARSAAEAASPGRPTTPRSVLRFFKVATDLEYQQVDAQRDSEWRRVMVLKTSQVAQKAQPKEAAGLAVARERRVSADSVRGLAAADGEATPVDAAHDQHRRPSLNVFAMTMPPEQPQPERCAIPLAPRRPQSARHSAERPSGTTASRLPLRPRVLAESQRERCQMACPKDVYAWNAEVVPPL